jgi:hypothetical protein
LRRGVGSWRKLLTAEIAENGRGVRREEPVRDRIKVKGDGQSLP